MSLRNYGSYALFSVLVFLVTCGFLFPLFAPVDDVVGELSTETKATESPLERCDVVIVGAGVGGLYTAFHLSAKLGDRLCLIDDRERAGGKVQSYPIKGTDVLAPTCAEQMRDIDVQLRCLCRDLNVSVWVRGEVSLYFHNYTQFSGPNQFETTDGGFRICLSCFFLAGVFHRATDDQGAKYMVKDGPQQVLLKMFQKARERGMRVWQKERVEYLENHGGGVAFLACLISVLFLSFKVLDS
jgi:2-polyprenyl-6-methoxyphenol hydroxylase-like FAD-dependent oxidoreductase